MNTSMRDDRPDVDRILLAAELANSGEHSAAMLILTDLCPGYTLNVERQFERLRVLLVERDEVEQKLRLCSDDPRHYIDTYEDDRPRGSLQDWADRKCSELQADLDVLTADGRRGAESIAEWAERPVAA